MVAKSRVRERLMLRSLHAQVQRLRAQNAGLRSLCAPQKDVRALAQERLDLLFSQAPVGIFVAEGPDLVFTFINEFSYQLLGNKRNLLGKTIMQAMPEVEAQGYMQLLHHVYTTGEPYEGRSAPLELKQPGGQVKACYVDFIYQAKRNAQGRIDGVMMLATDVTVRVLASQRADALAEDLAAAVRVRDEFMAIASHELNTPLTALKLQLQTRQRRLRRHKLETFTPEGIAHMLASDHTQVTRLSRLVSDMLDGARMRAGKLAVVTAPVSLSRLASEVAERYAEQMQQAGCGLEVQTHAPGWVQCDRDRMEQVLANLLSNAMKYGAHHPVQVGVTEDEHSVRLTVRDYGRGIAPADQERIFAQFERAVTPAEVSGLGLGLFIAQQIVLAHGGRIDVDSQPGEGACFTVVLPRVAVATRL